MIDELPVQVLDAPLDLALVLRVRRMRKINLNTTLTALFLPLLLELAAVIRKNSLKKPLQPLQNRRNLSRRQLAGQTVHHKLINHFQRADMLKASADGSIVITLTPGLTIILLQPQSIRSALNLLNKRITHCLNKRMRFQAGTIVSTIAMRTAATIVQPQSRFIMASPPCQETAPYNHQTNCHAHSEDKRCNVRKLT